jgi:hypothetical protein
MRIAALALAAMLSACDAGTHTLYRSSVVLPSARIHIATFDAADGDAHNRENCELARDLFQAQPGVLTRFWCEPGGFKK